MENRGIEEKVKAFGMTNQMLWEDLMNIQRKWSIDLGLERGSDPESLESAYYSQFAAAIRTEAAEMSTHYATFYSLEKSIRSLMAETIQTAEGSPNWWSSARIPAVIQTAVSERIQKELDAGVTRRSLDPLDYTTFGELSVIISSNWDLFGALFNSRRAVERVMTSLNALRNPIAHCSELAEDEKLRLQLSVRDWFRMME